MKMTQTALLLFTCLLLGCPSGNNKIVEIECPACKGTGGLTCPSCSGAGSIYNSITVTRDHCLACNGSGKFKCATCLGDGVLITGQ